MPDLEGVGRQLQLDLLTVQVSATLSHAALDHVVLKGVTTALWLYDPPRAYRDVDVLVAPQDIGAAIDALLGNGLCVSVASAVGEEAPHSVVVQSALGAEVDLHLTLPTLSAHGADDVWRVLRDHREPFSVDGRRIPALDVPARCVVLALHVVASGHLSERVREDLRRARSVAGAEEWAAAEALADRLGVGEEFAAATAKVCGTVTGSVRTDVALRLGGGSASAIQLSSIARLPVHEAAVALVREAFPSRAFMRRRYPDVAEGRTSLPVAYLRRLRDGVTSVPGALREIRSLRGRTR